MKNEIGLIIDDVSTVLLDKREEISLALACILARGHLLIEDLPGVGKTTLVKALSRALGLDFHRIQFTNDLLPNDIIGSAIYDKDSSEFRFAPGPLFAELVLADEINRAHPRTQSGLLEALEERKVSALGKVFDLPSCFTLIATQNPHWQKGTFPLPESILDRFLMGLTIGLPQQALQIQLYRGFDQTAAMAKIPQRWNSSKLVEVQQQVGRIFVSESIGKYIYSIMEKARSNPQLLPISPRAGLGLSRLSQAWAWMEGRDHVLPDDVKKMAPYGLGHRVISEQTILIGQERIKDVLEKVEVV
ncbi:MAG: MoxR family ATPase [Bdellovibrionota bacterium]